MSVDRYVLPSNVTPSHYKIELSPDLELLNFTCTQEVEVNVSSACNSITMHSKEIDISSVSFKNHSTGSGPSVTEISYHLVDTTVKFTFDGDLPVGDGCLSIAFRGILNGDMAGFYKSGYTDANGVKKVMASTQFEALDARRAFPCWDEPSCKATFSLTMVIPANLTAISNMPETSSTILAGNKKRVVFGKSPRMSTYLLAWAVGEFDCVQGFTKAGVSIRIFSPPGRGVEGNFALDVGIRCLEFYDDFFQVPYPLPKLDMLCCTEFAMGAMENWGLVTYREVDLLIDTAKASTGRKQRVAVVVAHELAHQWFGNLVTMEWWDDLWLNEGFAAFMEHFALDHLFPDWNIWEQYTTDAMGSALRLDALRTSHPIQVPIHKAEEVEQVFDAISYCKGSTVVRMANCLIGPENFKAGLQVYMKRHKYGNTQTKDLWNAWSEVSGKDVAGVLDSWTSKMGHPVVSVVDQSFANNVLTVTLQQNWFLADGSIEEKDSDAVWQIPLMFATGAAESTDAVIMTMKTQTFTIPMPGGENDWFKINSGQKALIRVSHSDDMNIKLIPAIKSKALPPVDRGSLLLDSYALAKAGVVSIESVLVLLRAYENEDNYSVWTGLAGVLGGLHTLLQECGGAAFDHFQIFATKIVKSALVKVGWEAKETDGHADMLLRTTIVGLLDVFCSKDADVVAEARRRYDAHWEDASQLPSEYRSVVYRIVLSNSTKLSEDYEKILQTYYATEDNAEKKFSLASLGAAPSKALKLRTLDWAVKGSDVKLQDFFYAIGAVSGSGTDGVLLTWSYFQENVEFIKEKLGKSSPSLLAAVIGLSLQGFCTLEKATEIETYFEAHPVPSCSRRVSQIVETVRANGALLVKLRSVTKLTDASFWQV